MEFHVQHGLNLMYDQELEVSNIILMDCILERFAEAKCAKLTKAGFKLLGIGFIKKGFPSSSDVWSITTSPSKHSVCMSSLFIFIQVISNCFNPVEFPLNVFAYLWSSN